VRKRDPGEVRDKTRSDRFEYDPRWEVQPEPYQDDPGGHAPLALMALMAVIVVVGALVLLLLNTEPAF
jgi:hypothetical protein